MKLHHKTFNSPRCMLNPATLRLVIDFLAHCEFINTFFDLSGTELGWLRFIKRRIEYMLETQPNFGGSMWKCLTAYEKLLPRFEKLLS